MVSYQNYFKVGGSLRFGHPTYIIRKADCDIYQALKQKEFCYILNSRQMGKSSLRVRTIKTLAQEGFKGISIDLGVLDKNVTNDQWYSALVGELWRKLRLSSGLDDDLEWWRLHSELSPTTRFSRFLEDVVLSRCDADIIIFLDEIDNIINLEFRDEFLSLVRNCYERRTENKQYQRLTFCLLGVATPSSLRIDKQLSPFNIGRAINLTGFDLTEAQPLIAGLANRFDQSKVIVEEILFWTKGQPFLTQKLCALVMRYDNHNQIDIPALIQDRVVDNWEIQDEPEHLKTIRDRLLNNSQNKARTLTLYQSILQNQGIPTDGSEEQIELVKVSNPIYEKVFNQQWTANQIAAMSPYQNALTIWVRSNRQDRSRLLRGTALIEGQKWAKRYSITTAEKDFLNASEFLAIEEQKQAALAQKARIVAKQLAQEKKLVRWQRLFILFSLTMIAGFYVKSRQTNISNINTLVQSSEALFASEQKLDSLILAMQAKQKLNKSWRINQGLVQKVDNALQKVVYEVQEYNRLLGHQDRLYGIAVAKDGKLMASTATDNTVRLWRKSAQGWQFERELKHQGWVLDVAISQDSKTIVSASRDRTVKVWTHTGRLLQTLQHSHPVTSIAIKPNQKIVTGSEDGTIKIWQAGKAIKTLTGHTGAVESIALGLGNQIISGSEDSTIKIWQAGKAIKTLTGHDLGVRAVLVAPDGSIISGSRDKTLKIWNINGTEIATLRGHTAPVYSLSINLLNNQIVSASADRTLKIWDRNGTEITTLKGHTDRVWSVAYTPDGNIVSAGWDKTIRLWKPNNNLVKSLSGHQDIAIALDYEKDILASTSDDHTVKLWSSTGTLLKNFREHTAEVYDVAIHNQTVASVGADRTLKIWRTNGKLINSVKDAHQAAIWGVDISPNGQRFVTTGNDNLLKIWDTQGNLLHTLKGHNQKVWDVAINPQGDQLVSASEDNLLKIWDMQGNLLQTLKAHQDAVRTVAYTSDGKTIISGSEDRSIKLWQPESKTMITLGKHQATVKGVAISPDNRYLVSVDDDGKIIVWAKNNQMWQQLQTLPGHNSIWSVAFSPDSQTLATAGEDAKITLWNLKNILPLDTFVYGCHLVREYLQSSSPFDSSIEIIKQCHKTLKTN